MSYTGKALLKALPILEELSRREIAAWFGWWNGKLEFQEPTGAGVAMLRQVLTEIAGLTEPWQKTYNEVCRWWEYHNVTPDGLPLRIYGDTDGPKSCRKIEETVLVEEEVPVQWEKQLVPKTVVRWECREEETDAALSPSVAAA